MRMPGKPVHNRANEIGSLRRWSAARDLHWFVAGFDGAAHTHAKAWLPFGSRGDGAFRSVSLPEGAAIGSRVDSRGGGPWAGKQTKQIAGSVQREMRFGLGADRSHVLGV